MLDEADLKRLYDAFPDLVLTSARASAIVTSTTIAMSLGVTGLFLATAIALLRSARHK